MGANAAMHYGSMCKSKFYGVVRLLFIYDLYRDCVLCYEGWMCVFFVDLLCAVGVMLVSTVREKVLGGDDQGWYSYILRGNQKMKLYGHLKW